MMIKSLATASVAMLLVVPLAANAAKPTPVTIVDPVVSVEVANADPIPVTGAVSGNVEVTNDMVNTPYAASQSGSFVDGNLAPFNFDVPDGMRLIVETITVRYALDASGNAVTQMRIGSSDGLPSGEIALQQQGAIADVFGTKYWIVGNYTGKLRINSAPGMTDELQLYSRLPETADGTANMLVAGYLVPLP
jgi:hypothetical protein